MKRHCITLALILLTSLTVYGQTSKVPCDCAKSEWAGTKADTAFHLSNGKTIVLCGYKFTKNSRKYKIPNEYREFVPNEFSEFVLSVCGQDTIIGFWGAVLTCRLKVSKDTLLIQQIEDMALGKNFKFQPTVWTTEKIYFKGQKVLRKVVVNRQIPKYTQDEISLVLKTYENAKIGFDDSKLDIASKLFIATISGSKTARQYFKEYKSKCGTLDGAYLEDYLDLTKKLELWDKK